MTPSIAGTVFAALDFLTSYPYGCTEQTMSSFLPDVLVADAMKKLGVGSNIDPQTLNKQVQAGLDRLYQYQHPDGGWGWWQTDDSQPFMTAYVLAGLAQAKAAGYDVEEDRIDRARKWLLPQFTRSTAVKTDLRAYMAYALVLSGSDSNATIVDSVWNQRSTLTSVRQGAARAWRWRRSTIRAPTIWRSSCRRGQTGRFAGLVAHRHQLPDGLLRRHHAAGHGLRVEAAGSRRSAESACCRRPRFTW